MRRLLKKLSVFMLSPAEMIFAISFLGTLYILLSFGNAASNTKGVDRGVSYVHPIDWEFVTKEGDK